MASRIGIQLGLVAILFSSACKKDKEEAVTSELAAEAEAVAKGNEALLSANSQPEPLRPRSSSVEDFDASLHQLDGANFSRADIAKFQEPGSDLTKTPRALQGTWWMEGNPMPDETVSFARVDFSQPKPVIPVFGSNNFSFHSGDGATDRGEQGGKFIYEIVKSASLIYELNFSGSGEGRYDIADIIPTFVMKVGPFEKRLRLSPKVMAFSMKKEGEHLYSRSNSAFGKDIPGYNFKRILVPSAADPRVLEKTEWWESYEKQSFPAKLKLAIRK